MDQHPTESDLPAEASGSSTGPIWYKEPKQMRMYLRKLQEIWTFILLEEDSCNFMKWKKFFQGLPSDNFKQWDIFLNRYPDLKNLVGSLKEDLGSQTAAEYAKLKKRIQHDRGKVQEEVNELLTEMNAKLKKEKKLQFCGLETSPLNLKTREIFKDGSIYHYNDVRENLKNRFPGLLENVYCSPGLEKIEVKGKRKNNKCKKKEDQRNEYKGVIMVVNRFVRMFQTLFPNGNPMIILPNYNFANILNYVKDIKVSSQIGEFDVFIVSKKCSCFFIVEIKACNTESTVLIKQISKAKAQLFKYRTIIHETFRDRPDILEFPVYDSVAIPFVDRGTLKKKKAYKFETMKILPMDDLKDDKAFTDWFDGSFQQVSQHSSMVDDQYYTIVERFAGIGSRVDTDSSVMKFKQEDMVNSNQLTL